MCVKSVFNDWWQLLEKMETKMKGTCVDGTIPKLFEGRMLVCSTYFLRWLNYLLDHPTTVGRPYILPMFFVLILFTRPVILAESLPIKSLPEVWLQAEVDCFIWASWLSFP